MNKEYVILIISIIFGIVGSIIASYIFYNIHTKTLLLKTVVLKITKYFNCDYFINNPCIDRCIAFYDICDCISMLSLQKKLPYHYKIIKDKLCVFIETYKDELLIHPLIQNIPSIQHDTTYFGDVFLYSINTNSPDFKKQITEIKITLQNIIK